MFDDFSDPDFGPIFTVEHPPTYVEAGSDLYVVTKDGRVFADLAMLHGLFCIVLEPAHDEASESGDERLHAFYDGALRAVDAFGSMQEEVLDEISIFEFSQTLAADDFSDLFRDEED